MIQNGQMNLTIFIKRSSSNGQNISKNCLRYTAIREMEIKTILGFHLIPFRMATLKNS